MKPGRLLAEHRRSEPRKVPGVEWQARVSPHSVSIGCLTPRTRPFLTDAAHSCALWEATRDVGG